METKNYKEDVLTLFPSLISSIIFSASAYLVSSLSYSAWGNNKNVKILQAVKVKVHYKENKKF